jgi:hypothetical protein
LFPVVLNVNEGLGDEGSDVVVVEGIVEDLAVATGSDDGEVAEFS